MDEHWQKFIDSEMSKEYMVGLREFITERRKTVNVLPAPNQLFNAFKYCPWNNLKVIIIGQDPYPTKNDAHGLAFSSLSQQTPYSLQNIFDEIFKDIYEGNNGGVNAFQTNNLTQWAEQGVLLLNSCLTTEEGKVGIHKGKGWELFIENTISYIDQNHKCRLVWMLWGKDAKQFKQYIKGDRHLILESDHPAAARHNKMLWFGNKHFSKANNFINKNYFNLRAPIIWGTFVPRKNFR